MNREECLDVLKNMANCWIMESLEIDEASKEADEVIEYFTELVERDTPKKITVDHDGEYSEAYCPNCHEFLDPACIGDFCAECGQRLEWSE